MELYNFNSNVYNEVVKLVKIRFHKQIRNSGIVFNEILLADNLVNANRFYILISDDQYEIHYIRFIEPKLLLIRLSQIAQRRLKKLISFEKELLKINDTESYGEARYFNDTEITAIGISSINELLIHFEKKLIAPKSRSLTLTL